MIRNTTKGARLFNSIYWLALALWVGSLAMAIGSAIETFPTMEEMNVTVPALVEFDAMAGHHSPFAAGRVQNKVFFLAAIVQDVCVLFVAGITILHFTIYRWPIRRPANLIRILAVLVVLVVTGYQIFVLGPRMNRNIRHYWDLPTHKQVDSAMEAKAAFDADHTSARGVLLASLLGGMTIIVSTACAMTPGEPRKPTPEDTPSGLEKPALAPE